MTKTRRRDPRVDETTRSTARPCVLVVGCSHGFMQRCQEAVAAAGALVKEAGVRSAVRTAERFQPLVIVMLDPVFAFDPPGFEALARNAGADLLLLRDERVGQVELDARLLPALLDLSRRRALAARIGLAPTLRCPASTEPASATTRFRGRTTR